MAVYVLGTLTKLGIENIMKFNVESLVAKLLKAKYLRRNVLIETKYVVTDAGKRYMLNIKPADMW